MSWQQKQEERVLCKADFVASSNISLLVKPIRREPSEKWSRRISVKFQHPWLGMIGGSSPMHRHNVLGSGATLEESSSHHRSANPKVLHKRVFTLIGWQPGSANTVFGSIFAISSCGFSGINSANALLCDTLALSQSWHFRIREQPWKSKGWGDAAIPWHPRPQSELPSHQWNGIFDLSGSFGEGAIVSLVSKVKGDQHWLLPHPLLNIRWD